MKLVHANFIHRFKPQHIDCAAMPAMPHILVIDDDPDITRLLSDYLQRYRFSTACAHDATSMRERLAEQAVDLVVLDWMLPGTDGLTLARELRLHSRLPVIMLTARAGSFDCVMSLENGADDYMSKPFDPRELVARIQAVLRRVRDPGTRNLGPFINDVIGFDGWQLHMIERHLRAPDGTVLPLSNAEFRLLTTFLRHPRKLLTREQLMDEARGRDSEAYDRSIDLLVSRLRSKLARVGGMADEHIKTIRGAGYMLNVQQVHGLSPSVH